MDLQKTDRLYGEAASSLFARREIIARDDAGRSEAFRSFLKDAESRRTEDRLAEKQSASRRDEPAPAGRDRVRDDRVRDDRVRDDRGDNRAASKSGRLDETRPAAASRARPDAPVVAGDAMAAALDLTAENPAATAAGTARDGAAAGETAPQVIRSAITPTITPAATETAGQPAVPETAPVPVAVGDASMEPLADTTAEAAPAEAAAPAVQAQPADAGKAGQKKTKVAEVAAPAPASPPVAQSKIAQPNSAEAADSAADPALSAVADGALDAASGDVTIQTIQTTAQNAAVPTTVEGEAKVQPVEAASPDTIRDVPSAGTPPAQPQPPQQGMPAMAQNGAATAAAASAGASAPAMAGGTQEPGLESLAADAGRGARNAGEPAAPAASGQGAVTPAGTASSGGAQANAGGDGNGQSAGQNAAAEQPRQSAGADQPGMRSATNDSFTTLLARAQGEAQGVDPMAAGTARPGEGTVATPGASATPGTQATAAAAAAVQASAPAVPRPPMPVSNQVAIQLHNAAKDDVRRVTIHLRPEAMGKVEVSMEVDQAGRLQAVISADKAEALDWLRRDAHHLERALQDAGMKMDQQSLSFNLRGDGQSGEGGGKGSGGRGGVLGQGDEMVEAPADGIVRRLDALVDVSV